MKAHPLPGTQAGMKDEPKSAAAVAERFAVRLEVARQQHGQKTGRPKLTQREFARDLEIGGDRPEERYRLYERGQREMPLWLLAAVRRVTGFSLDELIAGMPPGDTLGTLSFGITRGERLRRMREIRKATLEAAAQELDVDPKTWASYEDGHILVPEDVLSRFGLQFEVSLDFLFHGHLGSLSPELYQQLLSREPPAASAPRRVPGTPSKGRAGNDGARRRKPAPAGT
jgi:transcriptional regulator with XRE-family HTH domain